MYLHGSEMRASSAKELLAITTLLSVFVLQYKLFLSPTSNNTQKIIRSEVKVKIPSDVSITKTSYNKAKLILSFTNIYGLEFDVATYGRSPSERRRHPDPLSTCEYRCEWTTNRADYKKSDAVLFHLYNNLEVKDFVLRDLPTRYSLDQKWILMIREPPAFFLPQQLKLLNNKFNLTMTFQSDSDVSIPYGRYWKILPAELKQSLSKIKNVAYKTKMVAWLVSNCITSSRREDYVAELKLYIDVDVYGDCGKNVRNMKVQGEKFRQILAERYKFYLAFENSDCDEYVTEKFWTSLMMGMIPIVRGQRSKYERFAPPNSYINADSFVTPRRLADYLKAVSSNITELQKYHQWRTAYSAGYQIFTGNRQWMCDLCQRVHRTEPKTIDVYDHFSEDKRCFTYLHQNGRNRTGERIQDIDRV